MKRYIKDEIIKFASEIVIIKNGMQIINPSEEQILADGWIEYIPPTIEPDYEAIFKAETEQKVREMVYTRSVPTMINTFGLTNKEALSVKDMFPKWEVGIDVVKGDKYHHITDDKLYECDQDHKTQENWSPDKMSSLWHEVSEHEGTIEDPIPYNEDKNPLWQGMVLEEGKYYIQDSIKYKCTRNTEIKVTQDLSALVGIYVEVVE